VHIGVLLAAGRSRRMGRPKQLLLWPSATHGPQTIVAAAFDAIKPVCEHMVVVVGHQAQRATDALHDRNFDPAHAEPDAPMFESINRGMQHARHINKSASIVLHPADHPAVRPETVRALVCFAERHPQSAVMPEHETRGGHPAIIPPNWFETINAFDGTGGLRALWREHPEHVKRMPCDDPGTVMDLDTIEQYHQNARP